jgi:hypothetical protein
MKNITNITMKLKTPRNKKGEPHGYWQTYYNKLPWFNVYYINGNSVGLCIISNPIKEKHYHAK